MGNASTKTAPDHNAPLLPSLVEIDLRLRLTSLGYDHPTRSWAVELQGSEAEPLGTGRITNPFSAIEEEELTWYLQKHAIKDPYANKRAGSVTESLARYRTIVASCLEPLLQRALDSIDSSTSATAIVLSIYEPSTEGPSLQSLHWEFLEDRTSWKDINIPVMFARGVDVPATLKPGTESQMSPSPSNATNILVLSARPGGRADHPYRLISQPLWDLIHSDKDLVSRFKIHFVRPGTWSALRNALLNQDRGPGFFSIVHFDTHGIVDKYGR